MYMHICIKSKIYISLSSFLTLALAGKKGNILMSCTNLCKEQKLILNILSNKNYSNFSSKLTYVPTNSCTKNTTLISVYKQVNEELIQIQLNHHIYLYKLLEANIAAKLVMKYVLACHYIKDQESCNRKHVIIMHT